MYLHIITILFCFLKMFRKMLIIYIYNNSISIKKIFFYIFYIIIKKISKFLKNEYFEIFYKFVENLKLKNIKKILKV